MKKVLCVLMTLTALTGLSACQSAYYASMEKFGIEKRDILVDRVEDARDSQQEAQEQFSSALEQFSVLINFDGGELETLYDELDSQYESSVSSAQAVTDRIDSVEQVANALFDEWQTELEQYSNASLKAKSAAQLKQTQRKYHSMIRAMRDAEASMQPVLAALKDNVLFLKHNLNASAIGALQGELTTIKSDVAKLVKEMRQAIALSDEFISQMK